MKYQNKAVPLANKLNRACDEMQHLKNKIKIIKLKLKRISQTKNTYSLLTQLQVHENVYQLFYYYAENVAEKIQEESYNIMMQYH